MTPRGLMPHKCPIKRLEWQRAHSQTEGYKARKALWQEKRRQWRFSKDGRDEYYALNIQKLYGITLQDYYAMRDEQNGQCAICGKHESSFKKRLGVDHCHKSGKVRGLLCFHCNHAIGKLDDSPKLLRTAADYLERSQ